MFRDKAPLILGMAIGVSLAGCSVIDKRACKRGDAEGCQDLMQRYTSAPPVEPDQLSFFANLCAGGRIDACIYLASMCADNNDVECTIDAVEMGCRLGSPDMCEMLDEINGQITAGNEPDCSSTEAKCLEALRLAEERYRSDASSENHQAYFTAMDSLCHSFKRGDACYQTALLLKQSNQPTQKVLEHLVVACQYGDMNSCELLSAAMESAEAAENKKRCFELEDADACYEYAMELLPTEEVQAQVLIKWVCTDKKHPQACRKCRSMRLGCNKPPPRHKPPRPLI